jgi:DNA modification methylase
VDLVVTSPPFFAQRTYLDYGVPVPDQIGAERTPAAYVERLVAATAEMRRILRGSGSIFVNMGDKYCGYTNGQGKGRSLNGVRGPALVPDGPVSAPAVYGVPNKSLMGLPWRYALACMDDLGLILRAEIIWRKSSVRPERVKDRAHRIHEQWFHFTVRDRYYCTDTAPLRSVWTPRRRMHSSGHPAQFPFDWPADLIVRWCPPGGVVVDPFGGNGTTAAAAHSLGRHGVSFDLSLEYSRAVPAPTF